jgi:hypothetical protein
MPINLSHVKNMLQREEQVAHTNWEINTLVAILKDGSRLEVDANEDWLIMSLQGKKTNNHYRARINPETTNQKVRNFMRTWQ